jgi:large subunit ribosomal protein L10
LKGAYVEETLYVGDDQLDTLAALKSKEELIGDVVGILQSPAQNVLSALQSGSNKLSGILKTLGDQEES